MATGAEDKPTTVIKTRDGWEFDFWPENVHANGKYGADDVSLVLDSFPPSQEACEAVVDAYLTAIYHGEKTAQAEAEKRGRESAQGDMRRALGLPG